MATKHLYSVVAKLISFWPDLNDWPTEWLTVKLKSNNNKPTKISHNFLLLSKFYAGLLILTLHLPEPWYPVCGMLLCVSLCIMPRCIRIHYEPYVNWFSFYYPQEFKLWENLSERKSWGEQYFQEAWKSSSSFWIVKASKRELY